MSLDLKTLSLGGLLVGVKGLVKGYFGFIASVPTMILSLWLTMIKSVMSVFTYHIFTLPDQPLHNETVLILGSDGTMGRLFAAQTLNLNGTAICIDTSKERGDVFVKCLNDSVNETRAYFYECDPAKPDQLGQIIDTVTNDIGDISIVLSFAPTACYVASYINVVDKILPTMKGNKKGNFAFIHTMDPETRNVVMGLYKTVQQKIQAAKADDVKTTIAHVFPSIGDNPRNIFGRVSYDKLAFQVFSAIYRGKSIVYFPEYMINCAFMLKFLPSPIVNFVEDIFFGNKKTV